MNNVHCRRLQTITRNIFVCPLKQKCTFTPSIITQSWCSTSSYSNSQTVTPVKLAYVSYELMTEHKDDSKHPILIMHGLFGSKNNWNSLAKAIHQKTNRKVIAVDARNHGDSPHSTDMSYEHMAADVVNLLSDLGFTKATLVGHSMGGSTMMYVALKYPNLVENLIVVDMSPVRTSRTLSEMTQIFKALRSVTLNGSMTLSKARKVANDQLASTIQPLSLRQFLTMNLVEAEPGKFKWRVNLPVLEQSFSTNIAKFPEVGSKTYTGPTLFIGGGNSDFIAVKDHDKIKELFPSAEIRYIAGANHWVHADKPAEFLNMLTNFINQTHL